MNDRLSINESLVRIDQFRRAMGSEDMVNTMLNYGYSLLEAEYLRAINSVGLDGLCRVFT